MMNIYKISLKLHLQVLLILSCLFAISCTDDNEGVKINPEEPTATLKLSIRTPGSSLPKNTRADSETEDKISRIKVLVFKQVNDGFEYQYRADGEEITPASSSNPYTTFTAKVLSSDEPLKLILIANYQDAFDHYSLQRGTSEEEVRQNLSDNFEGDLSDELPMYGEVTLPNLNAEVSNTVSVTMLRSIARVDVVNDIDPLLSAPFELHDVYIYRGNDRIQIIPDRDVITDVTQPSVTAASIPADANKMEYAYYPLSTTSDTYITGMYIPESLPVLDESEQLTTPTCIVVGGYYDGDEDLTYYRVDFNSGLEGHPFGQVLRNIKYVFNIKQVNERGWVDPDGAANNIATHIVAEMQIWNEMTHEMYFSSNDNYLGISSRKTTLSYTKDSEQIVYLQATLPFWIQPTDENGNPIGSPISSVGESFTNDFFKLTLQKANGPNDNLYQLIIRSLQDNRTDNPFTGYFQVYTAFWTFDVEVEQETYFGIYSNRIIRVLTITSLPGDLGTDDGYLTEGVSGDAMRKVLENKNNFSPSGTIPVAGVVVHNLLNETITATDDASMYILQKMLEVVDVVHLPYLSTPSVKGSELIYSWLTARNDRALILGIDDGAEDEGPTNANLLPYFANDGQWFEISDKVFEIGTFYAEEGSEPFFDGPFGTVDMRINMGKVEGTLGYNNGYNWETTVPILWVTESVDVEIMMTHGINTQLGVFYCGESELTSSRGNGMSTQAAESGTVTSQLDILMANIWSWIIERVVEGERN